jgi:RNA polymerase sigma-70 factor (ECF subfamily)
MQMMADEVEQRLRRLAEAHMAAVATYLRHRLYPLSIAELDDLIEDVLVVVWKRLDDCPVDSERAWMIGVARNVLNNARRSSRRRSRLVASLPAPEPSPSAEMWVLASRDIRDAMAQLEAIDREALMLHHWEGLTARDISVTLGIGVKAAESRLSRAQARLRSALAVSAGRNLTGPGH